MADGCTPTPCRKLFGFYRQLQQGQMTTAQLQQQNLCPVGIYVLSVNDRKLFEQADGQTVRDWLGALSGGNASGAATSQSSGGTTTATTPATTAP